MNRGTSPYTDKITAAWEHFRAYFPHHRCFGGLLPELSVSIQGERVTLAADRCGHPLREDYASAEEAFAALPGWLDRFGRDGSEGVEVLRLKGLL